VIESRRAGFRLFLVLAGPALASACGNDDGTSPPTTGAIEVTASTTVELHRGGGTIRDDVVGYLRKQKLIPVKVEEKKRSLGQIEIKFGSGSTRLVAPPLGGTLEAEGGSGRFHDACATAVSRHTCPSHRF